MKVKVKKVQEFDAKFLQCKIDVRYWEDAKVNGIEDTEGNLIPNREGGYWDITIDIESGRILYWPSDLTADIHYKVCDNGEYILLDVFEKEILSYKGYVPDFLSINDNGYGDYVILTVLESGYIKDWSFDKYSVKQLK